MYYLLVASVIFFCVEGTHQGYRSRLSQNAAPWLKQRKLERYEVSAAGIDPLRNQRYIKFIDRDAIHAACYVKFCYCGQAPFSSFVSSVHEMSCDTNRIFHAEKNVYMCVDKGRPHKCMQEIEVAYDGVFKPLLVSINDRNDTMADCSKFVALCYGVLLADAVKLFRDTNEWKSYYKLDATGGQPIVGEPEAPESSGPSEPHGYSKPSELYGSSGPFDSQGPSGPLEPSLPRSPFDRYGQVATSDPRGPPAMPFEPYRSYGSFEPRGPASTLEPLSPSVPFEEQESPAPFQPHGSSQPFEPFGPLGSMKQHGSYKPHGPYKTYGPFKLHGPYKPHGPNKQHDPMIVRPFKPHGPSKPMKSHLPYTPFEPFSQAPSDPNWVQSRFEQYGPSGPYELHRPLGSFEPNGPSGPFGPPGSSEQFESHSRLAPFGSYAQPAPTTPPTPELESTLTTTPFECNETEPSVMTSTPTLEPTEEEGSEIKIQAPLYKPFVPLPAPENNYGKVEIALPPTKPDIPISTAPLDATPEDEGPKVNVLAPLYYKYTIAPPEPEPETTFVATTGTTTVVETTTPEDDDSKINVLFPLFKKTRAKPTTTKAPTTTTEEPEEEEDPSKIKLLAPLFKNRRN